MKSTVIKLLNVELESGKAFEIEVMATGVYDAHYGADADGNRGMGVWLFDDVEFTLPRTDEEGEPLTTEELTELTDKLDVEIGKEDWEFAEEAE